MNRILKHGKKHFVLIFIVLILGLPLFFFFDYTSNEDRDYALNKEMFTLVHQLDAYRKQHNHYPKTLLEVWSSDKLCVTDMYTKCQKVHYLPFNNYQDFHLSMHSFTWVILWYRKDACVESSNNQSAREALQKFGTLFFFCAAAPEHTSPVANPSFPIYRQDKKIFDHPNEWPVL